jgi:hypothetical protein
MWRLVGSVGVRWRQRLGAVEAAPETDKWDRQFFLFNKIFRYPHFDIQKGDITDAQIFPIFHRDSWNYNEQLSFLTQL